MLSKTSYHDNTLPAKQGSKSFFHSIQPKLTVNEPGDPFEQEADETAEKIMRMHESDALHQPTFFRPVLNVQRKCKGCEEEEQLQRKETAHETTVTPSAENYVTSISGGRSLKEDEKSFFEPRFGYDFSNVRLHSDPEANQSAKDINALAYTFGTNIVFAPGRYQPETDAGKRLMAHELTHVIQQSGNTIQRQPNAGTTPTTSPPDTSLDDLINPYSGEAYDPEAERLRQGNLRTHVTEPLQRNDATGFITRLRTLDAGDATALLSDDSFWQTMQQYFRGPALWSVLHILYSRSLFHPDLNLLNLLGVAIHDQNAQRVTDLLSLIIHPDTSVSVVMLLRVILAQVFGSNPLYPQMLQSILGFATTGEASGSYREAHYERNAAGNPEVQELTGNFSANFRTTPTEMRVIVKLRFVQPGSPNEPFYFIGGDLPGILDSWLNTIQNVWNNKFILSNGVNNLRLTFVPLVVEDRHVEAVEVHTNNADHCTGVAESGRANESCWFSSPRVFNANAAAHEFGHKIGASDEYHLPAAATDIPANIRSHMTAQDISMSTQQGIGSPATPSASSGVDISNSLMSNEYASQNVEARHVQRLVDQINTRLPSGVPVYSIRRTR